MKAMITAVEMARSRGINPKDFRRALRAANLAWHSHNDRWSVPEGSREHEDMEKVLSELVGGLAKTNLLNKSRSSSGPLSKRSTSDEAWIIDLCDKVLGQTASRQHRFPFLLGDPGPSGRRARLPVDAYYSKFRLVVEYHERQHTSSVDFFDRRETVSGVGRGAQRRLYDQRRMELLPKNGCQLIVLDYSEFKHTPKGRLLRDEQDEEIIAERLRDFHSNS